MLKKILKFFKIKKTVLGQKGYTLIELAISTSIISVLAVGGLQLLGKKSDSENIKITNNNIQVVEKAIKSFLKVNNFIPCPSLPNLNESNKDFGYSDGIYDPDTLKCSNKGLKDETGAVPVRTLKIADKYAYDAWGRKLTYRTASGSGSTKDFYGFSFSGNIDVTDLNGNLKTSLSSDDTNNQSALYIIISHGANGKEIAWRKDFVYPSNALDIAYNNNQDPNNGPILPQGIEQQNANHKNNIYIQNKTTQSFDDIVYFATNKDILPVKLIDSNLAPEDTTCSDAKFISKNNTSLFQNFINKNSSKYSPHVEKILKASNIVSYICDNSYGYGSIKHPNDISGLSLWLDASDGSNVFSNSGCSQIASSNGNVGCWKDKGSNNIDLTSNSISPVFKTEIKNGLSAIEFAGNSSMATSISNSINSKKLFSYDSTGTSIFIVQRYLPELNTNVDDVKYFFNWGGSQLNEQVGLFIKSSQEIMALQYGISRGYELLTSPSSETGKKFADSWNIISISKNNDLREKIYINGSLIQDNNVFTTNNISDASSNYKLAIGSHNTLKNYFTGDIGEVIIYNNYLSSDKQKDVENYLSSKWNIILDNDSYNPCSYGKEFKKTVTDPTGSCYCPEGYIETEKLDSHNACIITKESNSECTKLKESSSSYGEISNAGMLLWLDSNDCSTIKINGSNVESWEDKSPNNNDFEQKSSNKQPSLIETSINNNSVIRFSQTDNQNLNTENNINLPKDNDRTIFLVINPTSNNVGENNIIGTSKTKSVAITDEQFLLKNDTGFGTLLDSNKVVTNNSFHLISMLSLSKSTEIWIDGVNVINEDTKDYLSWNINQNLEIGGISGSSSTDFFDGDISEIIIYNYAMNATEKERVEKYLNKKWNLFSGVKNINSLSLWLDASTLPYNKLDKVHTWIDKSNNSFNAKATNDHAPIFTTNNKNKAAVYFDGIDDFMALNNKSLSKDKGSMFFVVNMEDLNSNVVLYANDSENSDNIFDGYCTNLDNLELHLSLNQTNQQFVYQNGLGTENCHLSGNANTSFVKVDKDLIVSVLYTNNGSATVYINGDKESEIVSMKSDGTHDIERLLLGSYASNNSKRFKGFLNEVILFNENLYSSERSEIEEYLSKKWEIPLHQ